MRRCHAQVCAGQPPGEHGRRSIPAGPQRRVTGPVQTGPGAPNCGDSGRAQPGRRRSPGALTRFPRFSAVADRIPRDHPRAAPATPTEQLQSVLPVRERPTEGAGEPAFSPFSRSKREKLNRGGLQHRRRGRPVFAAMVPGRLSSRRACVLPVFVIATRDTSCVHIQANKSPIRNQLGPPRSAVDRPTLQA